MTPPDVSGASFDLDRIPFSYRGSWLNLSPIVGLHRRSADVHLVSHVTNLTPVLALVPTLNRIPVDAQRQATPASFAWSTDDGRVEAAFDGTTALRLRGRALGLTLRAAEPALTPFTGTYLFADPAEEAWTFTSYETGRRYRVTVLRGTTQAEGVEALGEAVREVAIGPGADGSWEAVVEEFATARPRYPWDASFDDVVARVRAEFADYVDAVAPWRTDATPAAELASYVLWSATVEPAGFVGREAVLMSMHWMDSVWSWDHCFNALALAEGLPRLALDQFQLPFDHQDSTGALPDSITHSRVLHNYVKPPIHGWALRRLRRRLPKDLEPAELEVIYDRLARWSSFWLEHRITPGRQLPCYHHGNDSGWDNSTAFDTDRVIESADLAAFLAVQLEVLGELAVDLGRDSEAVTWSARAEQLMKHALTQLWDGRRFVPMGPISGRRAHSESLLTALPIVAGYRLPAEIADALAEQIRGLLTEHGPATEPVDSPHYESDGYWRGPIWAPSTLLIEDGLRTSGYVGLADEVSARFRALCERSGFAENFDALTGEGLRDRAYTWTAAVYLLLAGEHVARTLPDQR